MEVNGTSNNAAEVSSRGQWGSRIGFILAAAGSAVGLGNIWKFPYLTGENGGGMFVLVYLVCVLLIGMPIMIAEFILGRSTQKSPVGAFESLTSKNSMWTLVGWMGVLSGFIILSYYNVVAGWTLNYFLMSLADFFAGKKLDEISGLFDVMYTSGGINLFWFAIFMILTIGIVYGGVKKGLEKWCNIMMPALFLILICLFIYSMFLPNRGFSKGVSFLFVPDSSLKPSSILEALGQAFFSLSLGMGAMLTYGSYLSKGSDIPKSSMWVCGVDTLVAILGALVIFPVIFAFGQAPSQTVGLTFKTLPTLFSQLPGGLIISAVFFLLLSFAALTSAISLLEVVASYFIDERKWTREKATVTSGIAIAIFGIPSAFAGAGGIFGVWGKLYGGRNFFDTMDYLATNWLLPLGGLAIAIFVGWIMDKKLREKEFCEGSSLGSFYKIWLSLLRFLVPVLLIVIFLNKIDILKTKTFNDKVNSWFKVKVESPAKALSMALEDKDVNVRCSAAEALGNLGENAKEAVPSLIYALKDKEKEVRDKVEEALKKIGRPNDAAIPGLINALKDQDEQVSQGAAQTLGDIGPSVVPYMDVLFNEKEPRIRQKVIMALSNAGTAGVPLLIEALSDQDKDVRHEAAQALGKIGKGARGATKALSLLLKDKEKSVRIQAAKSLSEIGRDAKDSIPALIEALNDPEKEVRENVVKALGIIGAE